METYFIELTDKTIFNVSDFKLLNVDKVGEGKYTYKLYIDGKGMTLRLTEEDYNLIREKLLTKGLII